MAPNIRFTEWWASRDYPTRPIIVKMEKNAWSLPELKESEPLMKAEAPPAPAVEMVKSQSAKQFTWLMLLQAHKAAGCLAWVGLGVAELVKHVRKRLLTKEAIEEGVGSSEEKPRGRLLQVLRTLLLISLVMLVLEAFTHLKGWQFQSPAMSMPTRVNVQNFLHWVYLGWVHYRRAYVAPVLQWLANSCTLLFLVQSVDRIVLCAGAAYIKLRGIKPVPKVDVFSEQDPESPYEYPMVLVQIPMCNEKECYEQSIGAVCQLEWPVDRLLIQVLDDSDDEDCQRLIRGEVERWSQKGAPIMYRHRLIRKGYKAGNLNSAMRCDYVKDYEFVAIFDADFQPKSDFLKRTVPHFAEQPDIALVQARWAFVNRDENLLTRLQLINLAFHFEVEQQVNGHFLNFFGFNGTAGVWRIKALEDSGGWLDRTTVEDMDIAVRAHLQGWKFIFLNDVEALCELPESYEAYKKQQHRWHSGPMQLFRLCLPSIIKAKISLWKKFNMVFLFFLLRKMVLPFYSFTLFCIILPCTMFVPEASLPLWVVAYVPAIMSILNIIPAPKSFPFIVPYLLFENTMSVTKFNAMVAGLFQLGSAYEWVVTKKTGRASEADLLAMVHPDPAAETLPALHARSVSESGIDALADKMVTELVVAPTTPVATTPPPAKPAPKQKKIQKMYRKELSLALLLLVAASRSLLTEHGMHFYFLAFQGLTFLVVGLDLIGEHQQL
eukprot:jgi/Mesen1/3950/ME000209S02952